VSSECNRPISRSPGDDGIDHGTRKVPPGHPGILTSICMTSENGQAAGAGSSGCRIYRVPPSDVQALLVPSGSGEEDGGAALHSSAMNANKLHN